MISSCRSYLIAIAFITIITSLGIVAVAQTPAEPSAASTDKSSGEPEFLATPEAPKEFSRSVSAMLLAKQFDRLDELGDKLRSTKKRWPGGRWVLPDYYEGTSTPTPGLHTTEQDWKQHMQLVRDWVEAKPKSINARIALAESWHSYAWFARGNGYADSVTENGWKAFAERMSKAEEVLHDAEQLEAKCPQWYRTLLKIGLAQSWTLEQEAAVLKKAIEFEPTYYTYYRAMARYLAPQWNGAEGDAARYAQRAADAIGGDEGDIVYFEVASELTCNCDLQDSPIKPMDWKRIQRGLETGQKKYGLNYIELNQVAVMAAIFKDPISGNGYFERIGDHWSEGVWQEKRYFDGMKESCAEAALVLKKDRESTEEGRENMKTPEGQKIMAEFRQATAKTWPMCLAEVKDPTQKAFEIRMLLTADGTVVDLSSYGQTNGELLQCVLNNSFATRQPFKTKPPRAHFWVTFEMDPAQTQHADTATVGGHGNTE
jgi:hypothetical protein